MLSRFTNKTNKIIMKRSIFIKNKDFKPCISCVHFIEDISNYPYDAPANNEKYGKCKLFGELNLVTGSGQHDYAVWCRQDASKCGPTGKHHTTLTTSLK